MKGNRQVKFVLRRFYADFSRVVMRVEIDRIKHVWQDKAIGKFMILKARILLKRIFVFVWATDF